MIRQSKLFLFLLLTAFESYAQDMVQVPAGTFIPLYGDSTAVSVKSFYIDTYAVTNDQFEAFVKENPKWQKGAVKELFADGRYLNHWVLPDGNGKKESAESPVTNVSWFAAKEYCKCQNKRLPTTAEWEYVGMASADKANATGDAKFYQQLLDWYSRPNSPVLPSVTSGVKNYYGVYGMHGLIWEWVYDFNSALMIGESRTNASVDRDLFCAGGSAGVRDSENYAAFLRYAFRSSLKANYTVANLGFRCARDKE